MRMTHDNFGGGRTQRVDIVDADGCGRIARLHNVPVMPASIAGVTVYCPPISYVYVMRTSRSDWLLRCGSHTGTRYHVWSERGDGIAANRSAARNQHSITAAVLGPADASAQLELSGAARRSRP